MMKKSKYYLIPIIIIFAVFIGKKNCLSEPSGVTSYLINEPMSLMDWGIYKFDNYVTKRFYDAEKYDSEKDGLVSVSYNLDTNKIVIDGMNLLTPFSTQESAKQWGKNFIKKIKKILRLDPETGQSISPGPSIHETYEIFFIPAASSSRKKVPSNVGIELVKITEITTTAFTSNNKEIKCKSSLVNQEVYCTDPE